MRNRFRVIFQYGFPFGQIISCIPQQQQQIHAHAFAGWLQPVNQPAGEKENQRRCACAVLLAGYARHEWATMTSMRQAQALAREHIGGVGFLCGSTLLHFQWAIKFGSSWLDLTIVGHGRAQAHTHAHVHDEMMNLRTAANGRRTLMK